MKHLRFVSDSELAVLAVVRQIEEIESERKELLITYDSFIRSNGFKNPAAVATYEGEDDLGKAIDNYEKKLFDLADKADKLRSKIGCYV